MTAWLLLLSALAGEPAHHMAAVGASSHDPSAHPDEKAPVERLDSLPAAFVGTWEPDVTGCSGRSDMVLEITRTHLTFHESRGRIHAVVRRGSEVVVILEMADEGYTWLDTRHFRLFGDTLYQYSDPYDANLVQRQRCLPGDMASAGGNDR
jgi:hypothetical protein